MRIEGVDPLILNQIQSQTQKASIQEPKKIHISTELDRRGEERRWGQGEGNLEEAVAKLNAATDLFNIKIRFQVDEEKGDLYVLVIDAQEGRIIRRIPPENVLRVASEMRQLVGLLLDMLI